MSVDGPAIAVPQVSPVNQVSVDGPAHRVSRVPQV